MKTHFPALAINVALVGAVAPAAFAQEGQFDRDRYVAVQERPQPEWDPIPVRAGAFTLTPSLSLGATFNDNIYAQQNNAVSDTILTATPQVDLYSNWSVHQIAAGAQVNHRQYLEEDDETATDYNAYVMGRLDVTRDFSLGARADGAVYVEPRYEPAGLNAIEPTEVNRLGGQLNAAYTRDRIKLEAGVGQTEYDYDNGQDFRDLTENFVTARASYAISPDFAVFVQGKTSEQDYDLAGTALNPDRDGERTELQAGVNFELAAPFRGEIAVGSVEDKKDSPLRPDTDGVSAKGKLEWFPTDITTLTFTGAREIFDPGLVNSASASLTQFGVRADHELRRNIIVFGEANSRTFDFEDLSREDEQYDLTGGLGYKLNPNARAELAYTFRTQESSGANRDRDFDQNIIALALKLYP
jgi:hypothetical protein